MQTNPEQNPEEEILEGVIVEPGTVTEAETVIEDAGEQNAFGLKPAEGNSEDEDRRERLLKELHKDPDSIQRMAEEARGMSTNNLEEVTANLERMKKLLRGFI